MKKKVRTCKVCGKEIKESKQLVEWIIDKPFQNSKATYFFHDNCLDKVTINGLN